MSIELTPDQAKALSGEGAPIRVVGPDQNYVLVSEQVYDRLKWALDLSEPTEAEQLAHIQEFGRLAGWLDEPNDYEEYRQPK